MVKIINLMNAHFRRTYVQLEWIVTIVIMIANLGKLQNKISSCYLYFSIPIWITPVKIVKINNRRKEPDYNIFWMNTGNQFQKLLSSSSA